MEHVIDLHPSPLPSHVDRISAPLLYLSSASAGWEGLEAAAFLEPRELECWRATTVPVITLVLFRGGSMRIESRHLDGPWMAGAVHDGDLSLRAGWGAPAEMRWKSISRTGTRTLHLRLSRQLLARTAEELADVDAARLSMVDRWPFRDPLLTQIGLTLWRELEQGAPAGKLYAQTAAHLLAVHLVRRYSSVGEAIKIPTTGGLTARQLRHVEDYIQARLSQDLSLEALAQQTGFSPYHFARLFRRTTGESPHQYVLRQRIERARCLLEEPGVSLTQIALATGFAHQSHLTGHFKRQLGLTPSAYRREHSIRTDLEQMGDDE